MSASPTIPQIPAFNSVVDDSPAFHQSLKYWTYKSSQIGSTVHEIASSLQDYHETGVKHNESGNGLSEVLNQSSQVFKDDDLLNEPFVKFSDALNRIECYRSMLLTQTQMLGVEPMMNMVKDMEKTKKCRNRVTKLSEAMHVSWEKFAALPHESNLTEPQQLDKCAHNMITMRQNYQLLLAEYIENIRDTNTTKKLALLQRVLEHMFAEFSYFNYCCQILKDLEPYMTELFESLQKKQRDYEQLSILNDSFKRETETKIDIQAQSYRKLFPRGDHNTTNHPSHFFNKVGGFISSGVKDLKKQYKVNISTTSPTTKKNEPDWELIDNIDQVEHNEECSQFYVPLNKEATEEDETLLKSETSSQDNAGNENENLQETNVDDSDSDGKNEVDGIFTKNKITPINIPRRFEQDLSTLENISKKGYLRIVQRGYHKSKYPLLYFILDKGYGELLSQGQDQKYPRLFAKLQLSNVKPCNPSETNRNYCFILTTSESEYILQASNNEEYEEWIREIQDGIMTALNSTEVDRRRSDVLGQSSKQELDSSSTTKPSKPCGNVVERIKNVDGNTICADCDCAQPGWASANIGVVICIECSGIHRGLGVQISKIKSLFLDKWDPLIVEFMESSGNTKLNKILEANLTVPKITKLSSKTERLDYIVAKYVTKSFCEPEKSVAPIHVEETVLSDSTDEDVGTSIMCLVKDCQDSSHCHPPNIT